jgi:hypothetical protein
MTSGVAPGDEIHVVFDDSALVAVGEGNVALSRLIHRAHAQPGWFVYTAACALVQADRDRPGTAAHVAALPRVTLVDLDLAAVLTVLDDHDWSLPHTRFAAAPSADRPGGAYVVTTDPGVWQGQPVRVLDLS